VLTFRVASLYPLLYRLEKRGWIIGRWVEKAGQRRRRYYRLTPAGSAVLAEQRTGWREFVRAINRIAGFEHGWRRGREPPGRVPQDAGVYGDRRRDPGARHWSQRRDLQRRVCGAAETAAVSRSRSSRSGVGSQARSRLEPGVVVRSQLLGRPRHKSNVRRHR